MGAFTSCVNVYLERKEKCHEHVPEGVRLCGIMKATLGYGHYNNNNIQI